MSKNTHIPSPTIAQIVALHVVGHQAKEIIDFMSVSCTSVWMMGCVFQLLDAAVHCLHRYLPKHSVVIFVCMRIFLSACFLLCPGLCLYVGVSLLPSPLNPLTHFFTDVRLTPLKSNVSLVCMFSHLCNTFEHKMSVLTHI